MTKQDRDYLWRQRHRLRAYDPDYVAGLVRAAVRVEGWPAEVPVRSLPDEPDTFILRGPR